MTKKNKALALQQSAQIGEWFKANGATIDDFDETGGLASTPELYFRWDLRCCSMIVAVRASFDRWLNSRDFVLGFLPDDELSAKAIFAAACSEHKAGHFDEGWGKERDIYPAYRRERKRIKAELRLAGGAEEENTEMAV